MPTQPKPPSSFPTPLPGPVINPGPFACGPAPEPCPPLGWKPPHQHRH
jgi:hypothetical protein